MTAFQYATPAGRINKLKGEILAHAVPVEVLGITGQQKQLPKNNGDTIVYRRYLPYGAAATNANTINRPSANAISHLLVEGTTPAADTLTPQDISVVMQQYGCLYQVTDKAVDLYEDDVPAEMKKQTGERVALVREMIRYGVLKGGTNKFYGGTGTTRATVNGKITLSDLRNMSRNLQANHAMRITSILAPSPNFATQAVEAGYLVFCHTDCESDIRDLPKFTPVAEYGSRRPIHEQEFGSVENFRFIGSPELAPYLTAGAAEGSLGLVSTSSYVDVYPVIVVGENAWGQVALRGANSVDPTWIPPGTKDKNDPLGQRGYVGAKFYMSAVILNQGWMAVGEFGVTAL